MKKLLIKAIQIILFESIWISIGLLAAVKTGIYVF